MEANKVGRFALFLVFALALSGCEDGGVGPVASAGSVLVVNFDADRQPLVRFDVDGNQVDSHGGEIEKFGDTYYWYGETYGCGFEWLKQAPSPFCGFRVYTSQNLTDWKDEGLLFDVSKWEPWQARCHWFSYGCFRPHVAFNARTGKYVLWVNVYDKPVGYYVLESSSPMGPFLERGVPRLAVNMGAEQGKINNGDHNLFVDDDGTGYLIFADWVAGGDIVIERLAPDYLNGTGEHVRLGAVHSEAPTLFKRDGWYYAMYSSPPNHAYAAAATRYRMAPSPLGPWSRARVISTRSCYGQPFHVSEIPVATGQGSIYLYQSDLWLNSDGSESGDANQAPAGMFWAPLQFKPNGEIEPILCEREYRIDAWTARTPNPDPPAARLQCDINGNLFREIRIAATRAGRLRSIEVPAYQRGEPDAALGIEVRTSRGAGLVRTELDRNGGPWHDPPNVSWAARKLVLPADVPVLTGDTVTIKLSSASGRGCFGFAFRDKVAQPRAESWVSRNGGQTWTRERGREPRLDVQID